MRVGMVGLDALYWPVALGRGLQGREGVEFAAAATLGVPADQIKGSLGLTPAEYAVKFGLKLYEQPEEMIAQEGIDTIALITRHSEHADWVERLAGTGVRMFIPKTFATTLEQADRIAEAGKRHGVEIAVGPTARYLPPMMAVRQALDQGLIGKPFALRICHHHGTIDVFGAYDWYRDPAEGGPELSLGWYGIDLMLYFMQDAAQSVFAEYGNYTSPDSPFMDCGRMLLNMESGGIASFDMYFCNRVPYPSWQMEILGPQGVLSIHRVESDSQKTVVSIDSEDGHRVLPVPEETPAWEMFWVEDFLHGRRPAVNAEDSQLITRISLAAREAAETGSPVAL